MKVLLKSVSSVVADSSLKMKQESEKLNSAVKINEALSSLLKLSRLIDPKVRMDEGEFSEKLYSLASPFIRKTGIGKILAVHKSQDNSKILEITTEDLFFEIDLNIRLGNAFVMVFSPYNDPDARGDDAIAVHQQITSVQEFTALVKKAKAKLK